MENSPKSLKSNRSIPLATVIPVLAYADVRQATEWLCEVFGFTERLQIGAHRAQLTFGTGGVIVAEYIHRDQRPQPGNENHGPTRHKVMVRIADVRAHFERAKRLGAQILQEPVDFPYGERQYDVRDIGGHEWTFSETLADVHPNEWGGPDVILKQS